ncbi:hypothetical protein [Streptomyces nigrescens]
MDAAQQLLEDGRRLVDGLDVDAPAGPAEPALMLSMPFLRVARKYLEAEAKPAPSAAPGRAQPVRASLYEVTWRGQSCRFASGHLMGASSPDPPRRAVMTAAMTVHPPVMAAPMTAPMKAYISPPCSRRRVAPWSSTIPALKRGRKAAYLQARSGFLIETPANSSQDFALFPYRNHR